MVRRGFTLVEVIVSLVLLATGALGLAAAAAVAQRVFREAELQERSVREAAALLDSLAFGGLSGAGVRSRDGIELEWTAPPGSFVAQVATRYQLDGRSVTLEFATRRIPRLPERQP